MCGSINTSSQPGKYLTGCHITDPDATARLLIVYVYLPHEGAVSLRLIVSRRYCDYGYTTVIIKVRHFNHGSVTVTIAVSL